MGGWWHDNPATHDVAWPLVLAGYGLTLFALFKISSEREVSTGTLRWQSCLRATLPAWPGRRLACKTYKGTPVLSQRRPQAPPHLIPSQLWAKHSSDDDARLAGYEPRL